MHRSNILEDAPFVLDEADHSSSATLADISTSASNLAGGQQLNLRSFTLLTSSSPHGASQTISQMMGLLLAWLDRPFIGLHKDNLDFPEHPLEWLESIDTGMPVSLSKRDIKQLTKEIEDTSGETFMRVLAMCLNIEDQTELAQAKQRLGRLAFTSGSLRLETELEIKADSGLNVVLPEELEIDPPSNRDQTLQAQLSERMNSDTLDRERNNFYRGNPAVKHALRSLLGQMPRPCLLPSGRNFLLRNYTSVMSSLIRGDADFSLGKDGGNRSSLDGRFLESLVHMLTSKESIGDRSPFSETVARLETEIMQGRVLVEENPAGLPCFLCLHDGETEPVSLLTSSNMFASVGSLALFLRYVARPGDLMFIEHPENHLSTTAQEILAEELIKINSLGLHLVMSTYSPSILSAAKASMLDAGSKHVEIWEC